MSGGGTPAQNEERACRAQLDHLQMPKFMSLSPGRYVVVINVLDISYCKSTRIVVNLSEPTTLDRDILEQRLFVLLLDGEDNEEREVTRLTATWGASPSSFSGLIRGSNLRTDPNGGLAVVIPQNSHPSKSETSVISAVHPGITSEDDLKLEDGTFVGQPDEEPWEPLFLRTRRMAGGL